MTTELSTVGIADHETQSFIGDSRIAGWLLNPETDFSNAANTSWWNTYWPFFYSLIHYGGANTAFAGTYVAASPSGQTTSNPPCSGDEVSRLSTAASAISYMKAFFKGLSASERPDVYGYEWYGNLGSPNYTLTCIASDMAYLAGLVESDSYSVPASNIFAGEGGTNQNMASGLSQFYESGIAEAAVLGHRDLTVWISDGNENTGSGTTGDNPAMAQWALGEISYPAQVDGTRDYPGPSGCPFGAISCSSPGYLNVSWSHPAQGWHWYTNSGGSACGSPVATGSYGWDCSYAPLAKTSTPATRSFFTLIQPQPDLRLEADSEATSFSSSRMFLELAGFCGTTIFRKRKSTELTSKKVRNDLQTPSAGDHENLCGQARTVGVV